MAEQSRQGLLELGAATGPFLLLPGESPIDVECRARQSIALAFYCSVAVGVVSQPDVRRSPVDKSYQQTHSTSAGRSPCEDRSRRGEGEGTGEGCAMTKRAGGWGTDVTDGRGDYRSQPNLNDLWTDRRTGRRQTFTDGDRPFLVKSPSTSSSRLDGCTIRKQVHAASTSAGPDVTCNVTDRLFGLSTPPPPRLRQESNRGL